MESIFKAIDDAVGTKGKLKDYQVRSVTEGKDSLGEVRVVVEVKGKAYAGTALSIDVVEASAKAYVRALNNAFRAGSGEIDGKSNDYHGEDTGAGLRPGGGAGG